jgi:TRAP-type C4-dicarboxylate transport system permease large subunit
MIPIIIIGGVVTGTFTPAEAGMIAVLYILVVLLPLMNRGHIRSLPHDFMEAAILYSLPMSAVAAASAVGWLLAYLGGPDIVKGWIQAVAGDNRIIIMYLMVIVLTIAGDFLDGAPAIAIFMPIIVALTSLGHINPVHMGVLIIVSLAFGLITPPYGLILLLSSTLAGVPFTRALRQSIPLYGIFFLVITLIIVFPDVVLWFPRLVIPTSVGCFPNPSGTGYICPPR